jgi:hypothetical protein
MMRVCSVDGCLKEVRSRGYCNAHHQAFWKHGDPLINKRSKNVLTGLNDQGYIVREKDGVRIREHVSVAENAIGRKLISPEIVHHVDGNRANNVGSNLVICPNQAYHMLLHIRQRAFDATGDATKRKCSYCNKWDSSENLTFAKYGSIFHSSCRSAKRREAYDPIKKHEAYVKYWSKKKASLVDNSKNSKE